MMEVLFHSGHAFSFSFAFVMALFLPTSTSSGREDVRYTVDCL